MKLVKSTFYDYLEVQPPAAYQTLIEDGLIKDEDELHEIIQNIYKLGKELNKPVVATSDSHYVEPHEAIYRKIFISGSKGKSNRNKNLPVYIFIQRRNA